ncbi:facilitated trehalose transporter Tret1-2 homolog isoform X1 [Fopius arisanus]|uniref:Facilitated trehalose transporter Tret1-2 homolog isoform X1 n=1 Tax=Fopius arisanus TaxID=64838 RepID=A0A9R1U3J1_9HYME|nr:PREDICTED: facilitated trehalose transporter Tret1-2 homolog isoform X1 [Fopius arisanus]
MTSAKITIAPNPKVWPQWLAASIIHILAVLSGLIGGWTSPYLAKLTRGTESLTITNDEASWIASLSHSSQPLGSTIAAALIYKFGAKNAVLLGGVPYALVWCCFLIDESVPWIYASKVFSGVAFGMFAGSFPLYIGEIANPNIRGALIGLVSEGKAIGYLLGTLLGAYLNMETFAIISLILTAIFLLSFSLFPNSPHHLIKRNRIEEAGESLKWYNRQDDVTGELEELSGYMKKSQELTLIESFRSLSKPLNRKTFFTIVSIHVFIHFSGIYTIPMYLEILLTTLKTDVIAPSLVVVCVAVVAIPSGLISIYTNDQFGRRTMLAVSSLGASVNFALIGVNFLLVKRGYDSSCLQWLAISEIMMYAFFVHIGLAQIPSCLLGEIFSPELKEIGSCIVNILCAFAAFVASRSYQLLLDVTSEEFMFFFYAVLILMIFFYTMAVVPETKGKSLQEIQEILKEKSEWIPSGPSQKSESSE